MGLENPIGKVGNLDKVPASCCEQLKHLSESQRCELVVKAYVMARDKEKLLKALLNVIERRDFVKKVILESYGHNN